MPQPYVIVSAAISLDGYLDDGAPERLILSGAEDFDEVDELRASVDAILVGATTVRRDDPALLVRSTARREARVARGLTETPTRVVVTGSGGVPGSARVLDERATTWVLGGAPGREWGPMLAELAGWGIRRLLVEGGARVIGGLLSEGRVDELRLAIAPVFVGESAGVGGARWPGPVGARPPEIVPPRPGGESLPRAVLTGVRRLGEISVLSYRLLRTGDERHLRRAIELSHACEPSASAFSVGAVLVADDGSVLGEGYSRRDEPHQHAEQAALAQARGGERGDLAWAQATMYSSLEPCSRRASHPVPCAQEILAAGIARVVYAWREPSLFVDGEGVEALRAGGVDVLEVPWLTAPAMAANIHLGIRPPESG